MLLRVFPWRFATVSIYPGFTIHSLYPASLSSCGKKELLFVEIILFKSSFCPYNVGRSMKDDKYFTVNDLPKPESP